MKKAIERRKGGWFFMAGRKSRSLEILGSEGEGVG